MSSPDPRLWRAKNTVSNIKKIPFNAGSEMKNFVGRGAPPFESATAPAPSLKKGEGSEGESEKRGGEVASPLLGRWTTLQKASAFGDK